MASSKSQPVSLKWLAQLREEKQEPFTLEVYLSERRCVKKSSSSYYNGSNLANTSNISSNHEVKNRRGIPNGQRILGVAINKLISYKNFQILAHCKHKAQKDGGKQSTGMSKKRQQNAIRNRSSSSSSTTLIPFQLRCSADAEMWTPRPQQNHGLPSRSTFQALKLHNLRKLKQTRNARYQVWFPSAPKTQTGLNANEAAFVRLCERSDGRSRQLRKKRCVREVFGPEDFGKAICEQISSWQKQFRDFKNINQLLHSDFSITPEEWRNFQRIKAIGIEIADAILYDIVTEINSFEGHGY